MVNMVHGGSHKAVIHTAAASALGKMLLALCKRQGIPILCVVRRQEQADTLRELVRRPSRAHAHAPHSTPWPMRRARSTRSSPPTTTSTTGAWPAHTPAPPALPHTRRQPERSGQEAGRHHRLRRRVWGDDRPPGHGHAAPQHRARLRRALAGPRLGDLLRCVARPTPAAAHPLLTALRAGAEQGTSSSRARRWRGSG